MPRNKTKTHYAWERQKREHPGASLLVNANRGRAASTRSGTCLPGHGSIVVTKSVTCTQRTKAREIKCLLQLARGRHVSPSILRKHLAGSL